MNLFLLLSVSISNKQKEEKRMNAIPGIETIMSFLPVIIPIIILKLGLVIGALVHLLKRKAVKRGSVALWVILIVLFQIIGPVLYFLIGREDS